ncbi:hypothetical protein [Microbacterium imperiale]|uniref:Uncharacterized protein n=1 Tax=Microbacterium imperiale TaxID=33884 RepID=A0A9W6M325_9MICO|nr:hypothetical protein [Microbacterium imperiale]GLJ79397.1 hypothetical protein GCM10017586_10790 [Microbacterium imperiale]
MDTTGQTSGLVPLRIDDRGSVAWLQAADVSCRLIGWAAPDFLEVEERSGSSLIPGTADVLRAHGMRLRRGTAKPKAEAEVVGRTRRARLEVQEHAARAGKVIEDSRMSVWFLREHGSVAGMLDAGFPALVDAAAAARSAPVLCGRELVDEVYRACAAIIARSLMLAQINACAPTQLNNSYARSLETLVCWQRPAPHAAALPAAATSDKRSASHAAAL